MAFWDLAMPDDGGSGQADNAPGATFSKFALLLSDEQSHPKVAVKRG